LLLRLIEVALFEQIEEEFGVAVADGIGFTVTVAVTGVPAQPPDEGVIV
jgi:hypothetical protein